MYRKFIKQYVTEFINASDDLETRIITRIDEYGAYKFLRNKSVEEIKSFGLKDFCNIFGSLYSTQRQKVYNDLLDVLNMEGTGVQYFRGFINKIIKAHKWDIDELHFTERDQIKAYEKKIGRKLGFGKGTISQLAHFCRPDKYPLYNTKSIDVIYELFNEDIKDNFYEFERICNQMVHDLKGEIEKRLLQKTDLLFREYQYVLLDDFVEFVYEIVKERELV